LALTFIGSSIRLNILSLLCALKLILVNVIDIDFSWPLSEWA
jgi:hypothetical protein